MNAAKGKLGISPVDFHCFDCCDARSTFDMDPKADMADCLRLPPKADIAGATYESKP